MGERQHYDIAVAGAGPVGLAFARSLAGSGLRIALIDGQPSEALKEPAFDGREIALTHRSMAILERLGVWPLVDPQDVSDLRTARVMDGGDPHALTFEPDAAGHRAARRLGVLVPNHVLRRALFALVEDLPDVTLIAGRRIVSAGAGRLGLDDGTALEARLLVAADSRFSTLRGLLGVGVRTSQPGRAMVVCRVRHETPHGHVAAQWFDHDQILALLPLNGEDGDGRTASVVLTLPAPQASALMALPDAAFEAEVERRMKGRLGVARVASRRSLYPLATTWSDRFAGEGFALIGDAAVGMNPVTAHGFNLGLKGQDRLAALVRKAHAAGRDIGAAALLAAYDAGHRRDALPLYFGTNALSRLFTDERAPARLARGAALRGAQALAPFRQAVRHMLTDPG